MCLLHATGTCVHYMQQGHVFTTFNMNMCSLHTTGTCVYNMQHEYMFTTLKMNMCICNRNMCYYMQHGYVFRVYNIRHTQFNVWTYTTQRPDTHVPHAHTDSLLSSQPLGSSCILAVGCRPARSRLPCEPCQRHLRGL